MIRVQVISPERVLFEGEVDALVAPGYDGELGVLRGHAPLMTLLGRGELRLGTGVNARRYAVAGGFMQVVDDQVRVVTEQATEA